MKDGKQKEKWGGGGGVDERWEGETERSKEAEKMGSIFGSGLVATQLIYNTQAACENNEFVNCSKILSN